MVGKGIDSLCAAEEDAALVLWGLKSSVSTPALVIMFLTHLETVSRDTRLCGLIVDMKSAVSSAPLRCLV